MRNRSTTFDRRMLSDDCPRPMLTNCTHKHKHLPSIMLYTIIITNKCIGPRTEGLKRTLATSGHSATPCTNDSSSLGACRRLGQDVTNTTH